MITFLEASKNYAKRCEAEIARRDDLIFCGRSVENVVYDTYRDMYVINFINGQRQYVTSKEYVRLFPIITTAITVGKISANSIKTDKIQSGSIKGWGKTHAADHTTKSKFSKSYVLPKNKTVEEFNVYSNFIRTRYGDPINNPARLEYWLR